MNVIPLRAEQAGSAREMVAAEVRAELARQKQTSNSLPRHIGKSQRYWYERLNARLSFSIDDLAALSALLRVPMTQFVPAIVAPNGPFTPNDEKAPTPKGEGLTLPELDSNQQPAGDDPAAPALAPVTPLPTRAPSMAPLRDAEVIAFPSAI